MRKCVGTPSHIGRVRRPIYNQPLDISDEEHVVLFCSLSIHVGIFLLFLFILSSYLNNEDVGFKSMVTGPSVYSNL